MAEDPGPETVGSRTSRPRMTREDFAIERSVGSPPRRVKNELKLAFPHVHEAVGSRDAGT